MLPTWAWVLLIGVGFVAGWWVRSTRESTSLGIPLIGGDDNDLQPGSIFSIERNAVIPHDADLDFESDERVWVLEISSSTSSEGPWSEPMLLGAIDPPTLPGLDEWTQAWHLDAALPWVRARYTRVSPAEYELSLDPRVREARHGGVT